MRILAACLLIVSFGSPAAQTSHTLRGRYGEPDIERFTVAGDIGLTVEYGSDGLACQIVIERKQPLLHSEQVRDYMAPEVVSEVIDELVPPASRGRSINSILESMGCAEGRIEEAQGMLLRQGRKRFGPPDARVQRSIEAIGNLERLEMLSERLLDVSTWDELLAE